MQSDLHTTKMGLRGVVSSHSRYCYKVQSRCDANADRICSFESYLRVGSFVRS